MGYSKKRMGVFHQIREVFFRVSLVRRMVEREEVAFDAETRDKRQETRDKRQEKESPRDVGKKMKVVSIMLNILLVSLVLFELVEDGLPETSEDDFWLFILVVVTPLITLYYLLFASSRESWLELYFRRKAAEEKQKLKQFEDRENKENVTMPSKPLLSAAELLDRINSELANRWPYPDRPCRVESLKKSSQISSNWAVDTDSISGADLSHMPECDSVRKAVAEELAAKYNVRWP